MSQSENHSINNHSIDEKINQLVESDDPLLFGTPNQVFPKTKLTNSHRNYFYKHIYPYRMRALGYKGKTKGKGAKESCGKFLTRQIEPFDSKKKNNEELSKEEREQCRKIQSAYTSLLQTIRYPYNIDFKRQFKILDNWSHNEKIRSEKAETDSTRRALHEYITQRYHNRNPDAKRYMTIEENIAKDPDFLKKKHKKIREDRKQHDNKSKQKRTKQPINNQPLLSNDKGNIKTHDAPWQNDKIPQKEQNNNTLQLDNNNNLLCNNLDNKEYRDFLFSHSPGFYEDQYDLFNLSLNNKDNDLFNLDSDNKDKSIDKEL